MHRSPSESTPISFRAQAGISHHLQPAELWIWIAALVLAIWQTGLIRPPNFESVISLLLPR